MRRVLIAAAATLTALGGPVRVLAQSTTAQPSPAARDSFAQALEKERATPAGKQLPSADRFTWGALTVPAGSTVDGPVASANGDVKVFGTVNGDVFALGGNIYVNPGADVRGSVLAVRGRVFVDGGHVRGEMRSAAAPTAIAAARPELTGAAAVKHQLMLTAAWFVVVLFVGFGVIIFSGAQLETVVQTLQRRFSAALLVGLAGQLGMLPLLALICLALVLSILGILLIPFAIVAYVIGAAGLLTMGALAAATVAGQAVVKEGGNVRVRAVQSMVLGSVFMALPWVAAALLVNTAWGEMLARLVAIAITWVAATAGFGAALLARGGVRRVQVRMAAAEVVSTGWQTPTPIGGVVAARRPTATPSSK